jgi:hypothetical protein
MDPLDATLNAPNQCTRSAPLVPCLFSRLYIFCMPNVLMSIIFPAQVPPFTPIPETAPGSKDVEEPISPETPAEQAENGPAGKPDRPAGRSDGRSPPWTDDETLVLISIKQKQEYKRETSSTFGRLKFSKKERDSQLGQELTNRGYKRTGEQASNRWDTCRTGYVKINDWNKRLGQPSYWELTTEAKRKLARNKVVPVSYRCGKVGQLLCLLLSCCVLHGR